MNAKNYTATVPEYATRWKLNIQTVRRFIREGRLHAVKVGRCYFLDPNVIPSKGGTRLTSNHTANQPVKG